MESEITCKGNIFFANNQVSLSARILNEALESLSFEPHPRQLSVLAAACDFAVNGEPSDVFVLNGYAGSGKTSVIGALIKGLDRFRRRVIVLAPTGRAAKVASSLSSHPASTIHRRIFRPNPSDPAGRSWLLARNDKVNTLFIVDEASLIGDSPEMGASGLLGSLVRYVYSAPGCRLLLVGDEAQLPPVGQEKSYAMNPDRLSSFGLNPLYHTLDVPLRQEGGSGIVFNADIVRRRIDAAAQPTFPELSITRFPEMEMISSASLADSLADSFAGVGEEETLVVTRSNRRANDFNRAIRNMVMFAEDPLERGDRLVISKNDYFWGKRNKTSGLIANGETATVTWVGKTEKMYGRFFTETELLLSDGSIITAQIMLRSLVCDGPSIPTAEMQRFYNVVISECEGELSERIMAVQNDPYYNALQVKYAYCVTCHKAQGGQWKHVYIDMGGITPDSMGPEFYKWLYTALTRATEKVFLINSPLPYV